MQGTRIRSHFNVRLAAALVSGLIAAGGASAQVQLEARLFTHDLQTGYATLLIEDNRISYEITAEECCAQPPRARIVRRSDGGGAIDLDAVFRDPGTGRMWAWGTVTKGRSRIDAIVANPGAFAMQIGQNPNLRSEGVLAAIDQPVSPIAIVVPDVVREPGSPDFGMTTDVYLANQTRDALEITAEYFADGSATSSPTASATVGVPAGAQVTLHDALGTLFSIDEGRGALSLAADGEFAAGSRTLSISTPGDPAPATPQLSNAVPASFSGTLFGLANSVADPTGLETSLLWFNPGPAAQVRLLAISGDGSVLGSTTRSLSAATNGSASIFDLIDTVPPASREQDSFFVKYVADQPLIVQAVVTNPLSGEQFRVDSVPVAGATGREPSVVESVEGEWHYEKRLIDRNQAEVCGATVSAGPELSLERGMAAITQSGSEVAWGIMFVGSEPGDSVVWDCDWEPCYTGQFEGDSLTAGWEIEYLDDSWWCGNPLWHSVEVSFEGNVESDHLITGTEVHRASYYYGWDYEPIEAVDTYRVVMRR